MIADADVLAAVGTRSGLAREVLRFVHAHPELGHAEHVCAEYLASTLAGGGLEVERGVGGMPTAFRATLRGSAPGRSVGIVLLYDAVPAVRADGKIEPVHSCGHGPIAGGVTAAARALAALRDGLAGTLVVLGCPADEIHAPGTVERGGGKALSAVAGVWDRLDAALYAHPEFIDTVSQQSRWMRRERATVAGTRSFREGRPQPPLDAAVAAVEAMRSLPAADAMLEHLELDGDVEEGAGLVTSATFLLFADSEAALEELARSLRASFPEAHWEAGPVVSGIRPDAAVTAAVADAFRAAGRDFVPDPPSLPFATDFGNVSQRVPAALIGIGRPGGWAFHTDEGAEQFASSDGEASAVAIAQVLALAAVRLLEPA